MMFPSKALKYAAVSGGVAMFGIIFGWVMFPAIMKFMLKKEMALSKKTDTRMMWEKIPFPLDFKIYFFNYTNVDEIQKGELPIVKEIGPYYFAEIKEKAEIVDHDEDDTITYRKNDMFFFKPELCGPGLTGEETIVMPHVLILATVIATGRNNMNMISMIGKAMDKMFDKPTDVFLRVKVMDILFRGLMINCAQTEFAPKAICSTIKKENIPGFDFEENNQFRFSFFGQRNRTLDRQVVTVKRGIKNIMEVGSVVAIDGEPEMKIWRDSCNEIYGSDGTAYPPHLTEKDPISTFAGELCRPFKPWYQKKTSYKGIKTNRYIVNIGDFANDPDQNCFCDAPDKCPPKGMMDLAKCLKAPIYVSLPHFLQCDPIHAKSIRGLNPNLDQHGIEIDFEPISGTLVVVRQRIQFSMELLKTEKYGPFKNLPGVIAPIFWIEEGFALNKTFIKMLNHKLFYPKKMAITFRWMLVIFGILGVIAGVVCHVKKEAIQGVVNPGEKNKVNANNRNEETEQKEISVIGDSQEPAKINM